MSKPRTFEDWCFTATTHITPSTAWEAGREALRAALLADRPDVAELCAWHRRNLCPLFKDNGSCDPSGECSCSMRDRIVSTLESLAKENKRLRGHAEALAARLTTEYTEGPCVDQSVGAALPSEVYAYRRGYPKEPTR